MYLIATGGLKETIKRVEQRADGSHVETEQRVYASFSQPLKAAIDLFKAAGGNKAG